MKKIFSSFAAALCLMSFTILQDVPAEIRDFIGKHYTNSSVVKYKTEATARKKHYKVDLNNGVELKFDSAFQLIEIEDDAGIPSRLIPNSIRSYVDANYKGTTITEWKKKARKQKVELRNGPDLEFDLNGAFLRIDD